MRYVFGTISPPKARQLGKKAESSQKICHLDQQRFGDERRSLTDGALYQGSPSWDVHGFVKALKRVAEVSLSPPAPMTGNLRGSKGLSSSSAAVPPEAERYAGCLSFRVFVLNSCVLDARISSCASSANASSCSAIVVIVVVRWEQTQLLTLDYMSR